MDVELIITITYLICNLILTISLFIINKHDAKKTKEDLKTLNESIVQQVVEDSRLRSKSNTDNVDFRPWSTHTSCNTSNRITKKEDN